MLRDIRVFPIFEGANDVLRSYIALNGIEPVAAQLSGLSHVERVRRQFEQIERNDDDRTSAIARATYARNRYHHTV